LSPALGKTLKDVDGLIDLCEKIVHIEVTITVFARLEDNPGFPNGCEAV
jgi:hypothetical protein